jgi:hypothetical protein
MVLLAACSGSGGDDETMVPCVEPTFTSIHGERLSSPDFCASAGCHDASGAGGQSYSAGKDAAHAALLSDTIHPVGRTTWPKRAVAGQPDQSFLYVKLSSADPPGDRMPLGRPPLPQCDLDAIETWIGNGAMND